MRLLNRSLSLKKHFKLLWIDSTLFTKLAIKAYYIVVHDISIDEVNFRISATEPPEHTPP